MIKIEIEDKELYNVYMRTLQMKRAYDREWKKKRRAELRAMIINFFGGKCEICGSTKNMEPHHDESLKLKSGGVKEREEGWILKHLDEIMLLCKSCHTRLHWVFRKLDAKAKKRKQKEKSSR